VLEHLRLAARLIRELDLQDEQADRASAHERILGIGRDRTELKRIPDKLFDLHEVSKPQVQLRLTEFQIEVKINGGVPIKIFCDVREKVLLSLFRLNDGPGDLIDRLLEARLVEETVLPRLENTSKNSLHIIGRMKNG
jgi:hypothetical protein